MKNKILIVFIFIFTLLLSAQIFAQGAPYIKGTPYISANVGASWLDDSSLTASDIGINVKSDMEFDTGYLLGAAIGYDFGQFRLEGEFEYRFHDIDKWKDITINGINLGDASGDGDVRALSFLVNGFIDFSSDSPLTPYVGVGIGFATIDMNDVEIEDVSLGDDDDNVFAYQLAAGVAYAVNPYMSLDLGYRYFATSDPEFDDFEAEGEYGSHNISLAVRYSF